MKIKVGEFEVNVMLAEQREKDYTKKYCHHNK